MSEIKLEFDDNTEITILVFKYSKENTRKCKVYVPLILALIDRLTTKQLNKLISDAHTYRDGVKKILDKDIMDCFELSTNMCFDTTLRVDRNNTDNHCICGVSIKNVYYIVNSQDICDGAFLRYMIGCECIKNWNEAEYDNIMFDKKKEKFPNSKFCDICKRKTDKISCRCKNNLKLYFDRLRSISENAGSREFLEFGKFENMTYLQLIKSGKYIHKNYIQWILSENFMNELVKEKLKTFIQNRHNYRS
jgi:hypothetical protein